MYTPTLTLGWGGTLAMGFNFAMEQLTTGGLFHGSTLNGLEYGALEITNNATASHTTVATTVGTLLVGTTSGAGTYLLSQSGQLSASGEVIGQSGSGTFNHSGGNNSISSGLVLANDPGSTGTYNLSQSGQLSAWTALWA